MEKIVASAYVLMHLTQTDFIAAFAGWLIRGVFDWYNARHKTQRKGIVFTNRRYWQENWDRLVVSNFVGVGLLLILPEVIILVLSTAHGQAVKWNSGFSGLIGLLAFEIVSALLKGGKGRLTRLISGEDTLPGSSSGVQYGEVPNEPLPGLDDNTPPIVP